MVVPKVRLPVGANGNGREAWDRACDACYQQRHTQYYRGLWLCDRDWRKRKQIQAVRLVTRKRKEARNIGRS